MFLWKQIRIWFLNMRQSIDMLTFQIEGFELPTADEEQSGADKTNLLVDLIVKINQHHDILITADPSYNSTKYEMSKTDASNIIISNVKQITATILPAQDIEIQKIYSLYVGNPDINEFAGYLNTITVPEDEKSTIETRVLKMLENIVNGHDQILEKYKQKTIDDLADKEKRTTPVETK